MESKENSMQIDLKYLYDIVFDANGNVKPCGRANCANLIRYIEGITHTSGVYGDIKTGRMNINEIKSFVNSKVEKTEEES